MESLNKDETVKVRAFLNDAISFFTKIVGYKTTEYFAGFAVADGNM